MEAIIGAIIGILIAAVVSGVIIWIISKLNLGLNVDNFGWAMLAGVLIGLFTNLIMKLVPTTDGILHFAINLIVSAVVIFACGAFLKGVSVKGYSGAAIAAVSIAVINFLLLFLLLGGAQLVGSATNP